jgi:cerevisin
MASPHICGLLAYLLSIQGTDTFSLLSGEDIESADASVYAKAYSLLPSMAQAVLPTPQAEVAPVPPKKDITPAQLKKALIALSSPGLLTDIPAQTPNLLAFNNATASAKK